MADVPSVTGSADSPATATAASPSSRSLALNFVLATCLPTWALVLTFVALSQAAHKPPPVLALGVLASLFPAVGAIAVQRVLVRRPIREAIGLSLVPSIDWLLGIALALVVAAIAFGVGVLWPGHAFAPDMSAVVERASHTMSAHDLETLRSNLGNHALLFACAQALLTGVTVNAVLALAGEVGWRGLLFRAAGERFGRATLLSMGGVFVWSIPVAFLLRGSSSIPWLGASIVIGIEVLFCPLATFLRARSGSVVAGALAKGVLVASAGVMLLVTRGGDELTVGTYGAPGLVGLALVDLAIVSLGRFAIAPQRPK